MAYFLSSLRVGSESSSSVNISSTSMGSLEFLVVMITDLALAISKLPFISAASNFSVIVYTSLKLFAITTMSSANANSFCSSHIFFRYGSENKSDSK